MKAVFSILLFIVIISIFGCARQIDVKAEQVALINADKEWAVAAEAGDIERVLPFWTDDAVIYFPNAPVISGKEAIRRFITNNRNKPGFSLTWKPDEAVVSAAGDIGYTAGAGRLTVNDDNGNLMTRKMNYICIWKKQEDGSWKCSREASNSRPQATE